MFPIKNIFKTYKIDISKTFSSSNVARPNKFRNDNYHKRKREANASLFYIS